MSDPTSHLVAPGPPDDSMTNGFVNPLDLFNYVSPTAWACKAIEAISGQDPLAWCTEWLSGDWESLWKFGDAMGNLARFMQDAGIEVQQGALTLDQSWDGNAGDAAWMYFSDLAAAMSSQSTPLQNSQESYHLAATGAWQFANQLGNLIQAIADEAIIAAALVATGTAVSSTGVGAVVGVVEYGAAALMVVRILDKINKVSQIINAGGTAVLGTFGLVIDASAQVGHLSNHPLPATGFSLPAR
ncbi:hypothetical protein AB0M20_00400 [Actinoplanes sp. NPDC051633]|uniref:hypothetical protein n=1 Tax=Actinoplanes sp. NPDC051633 TaxID=3155670 RepID=UPI00342F9E94